MEPGRQGGQAVRQGNGVITRPVRRFGRWLAGTLRRAGTPGPPPAAAAAGQSPSPSPAVALAVLAPPTWDPVLEEFERGRTSPETFLAGRRLTYLPERPQGVAHADAARLAQLWPQHVAALRHSASEARAHRFRLLGSGPMTLERDSSVAGAIDWYRDVTTGLHFPERVPHKRWDLYSMRPGNADVKGVWEVGRLQHLVPLAQAHALWGEEAWAREADAQLRDFMEQNPPGFGVNWTCTMDVALRAANLVIVLDLLHRSRGLAGDDLRFWLKALLAHGRFVQGNLEDKYEVTSNHYLSNVVGLAFLGSLFAPTSTGQEWLRYSAAAFEREIQVQILPDGADYESSIPYHRLVLECFLSGAVLFDRLGRPLSPGFLGRLARMADFLAGVLRPDGRMPVVGDADDGRVHIFHDHAGWDRQDARHVLAPAGHFLERADLVELAGAEHEPEAFWWGFDPGRPDRPERTIRRGANPLLHERRSFFPEAGIAVLRRPQGWCLATNGRVGTSGFGNHKHNDLLSFEYHLRGVPVIVDPGSHVYTRDFDSRNAFRSVAAHSTLRVKGQEQDDFKPEWLFRMFARAEPAHLGFAERAGWCGYAGLHRAYRDASGDVAVHRRAFILDENGTRLWILDDVEAATPLDLEWNFQLAPGWTAEPAGPRAARLMHGPNPEEPWIGLHLHLPACVSAPESVESPVSPSYGVLESARAIRLAARAFAPERFGGGGRRPVVFVLSEEASAPAAGWREWESWLIDLGFPGPDGPHGR